MGGSRRSLSALWLLLGGVLAAHGCGSGSGSAALVLPEARPVPAGVDSTIAVAADSLADASFVSEPREDSAAAFQEEGRIKVERTDSLWAVMAALLDSGRVVSPEDSLAARDATTEGGVALVALDSLLRASNLDEESLARRTAVLLDSAQLSLERAFQLDPFDTRSQVWLAQVYELQARRLGRNEAYTRAIETLEKLALLTPDQHGVYAMLANNYFYVSDWDAAAANYRSAEDVYLATYDLVVDEPQPIDSATVFSYVQAQGDMHVQRIDAPRARETYGRALGWATAAEDSAYVLGELEWMAWDEDNIRSAFARDSLLSLEREGELDDARRGYADLLPRLRARTAIDEIEWRLAIVEYNLGDTEQAAERLRLLVERTPTEADGTPIDPEYARYFDDYGTLCLNVGRAFRLEQRDRRTALKYFTQATTIPWSGRAVAHFEAARLLAGNPQAGLEAGMAALREEDTLSEAQRLDLYRLLMELNRRTGDFEAARRFRDAYRALRGG